MDPFKKLALYLLLLAALPFAAFADDTANSQPVEHKVEDPFWETNKFEFGPFAGMPMDVEFFRSTRVIPPERIKALYGVTVPDGYVAIANVRGRHVAADTLLGSASHWIVLLPMDHVRAVDFVSTAIFPDLPAIRHSAFRFHFAKEAIAFPQIRPKGAKNYVVKKARKINSMFFDTAPVDPKPEWTLTPEQRQRNAEIYQKGSLTPNFYEGFSANWREMKALTRLSYLAEEYRPPEARYVELELEPQEPARLLAQWVLEANKTKYTEPYRITTQNCYTDACRMLKEVFDHRVKKDLLNSCRRVLAGLPLGSLHELVRLRTLGLIGPNVTWTNLPIPKAP